MFCFLIKFRVFCAWNSLFVIEVQVDKLIEEPKSEEVKGCEIYKDFLLASLVVIYLGSVDDKATVLGNFD